MKTVICRFEYRDDTDGDTSKIKVYEKPVEIPEKPPIAFHALCQPGYHIFWEEKRALRNRIEEMEESLKQAWACIEHLQEHAPAEMQKDLKDTLKEIASHLEKES